MAIRLPVILVLEKPLGRTWLEKWLPKATLFSVIIIFMMNAIADMEINFAKLSNLASQRYGKQAVESVSQLQALLNEIQSAPEPEKLKRINQFFNQKIHDFDDDMKIWGQTDYWATPLEALGKEAGDCEDYSIAKYVFLKYLHIPNERLRLTYVRAKIGGPHSKISQAHMVLSYYPEPDAEPLILDNMISDIRPASRRADLTPIFSFNSEGLWVGSGASKGNSPSHLSRWRDLLSRVEAEGIGPFE